MSWWLWETKERMKWMETYSRCTCLGDHGACLGDSDRHSLSSKGTHTATTAAHACLCRTHAFEAREKTIEVLGTERLLVLLSRWWIGPNLALISRPLGARAHYQGHFEGSQVNSKRCPARPNLYHSAALKWVSWSLLPVSLVCESWSQGCVQWSVCASDLLSRQVLLLVSSKKSAAMLTFLLVRAKHQLCESAQFF